MRTFVLFLMTVFQVAIANAQSFKCEKLERVDKDNSLLERSLASVSFESGEAGWDIEYVNKNIAGDKKLAVRRLQANEAKGNKGNANVYEFVFNVSEDGERTFVITKIGSPLSVRCVAKGLAKGDKVTYQLDEEDDNLMRIETMQNGNFGVYPQDGKACVEITTTIDKVDIVTGWAKTETRADNGARVVNVVVDIDKLSSLRERVAMLKSKSDSLTEAGDYLALEPVDAELEAKSAELAKLADIVIGGDGIKSLALSVDDLGQKEKRRYAVIAITESFESLLAHARKLRDGKNSHTDYGYYEAMIKAYDKAIAHKDVPHAQMEALQNERNDMAALRKQFYLMGCALDLAEKAEKENGFESEGVYKNFSARCKLAEIVMTEHPEIEGVDAIYAASWAKLEKHPMSKNVIKEKVIVKRQVLTGKVVKGDSYLFDPRGMRVFSTYKSGKIKNDDRGKVLGKIGQDGSFHIVLTEPTSYIYIEGEKESRPITGTTSDMGTLVLESR